MIKNRLFYILTILVFFGVYPKQDTLANRVTTAYTLDLKREKPNFLELQDYHRSIVAFYEVSENRKFKNNSKYTFLNLIEDAYAASDKCFLAGHLLSKSGSNCRPTANIACKTSGSRVQSIRCNPSLYGNGQNGRGLCIKVAARNRVVESCSEADMSLTTPEIVKSLIEDSSKMKAFEDTAAIVESYCKDNAGEEACIDQSGRIKKIRDDIEKARVNYEAVSKGQSLGKAKSAGILDQCEKTYRNEAEDNLFGSFFMSRRNIGERLLETSCSGDQQVESVSDEQLRELSKDFDKVYKHTSVSSMLTDSTKIGAELSVKNLIIHHLNANGNSIENLNDIVRKIRNNNSEFKSPPYDEILVNAKEEFEKAINDKRIKVDDRTETSKSLSNFLSDVNNKCREITEHIENEIDNRCKKYDGSRFSGRCRVNERKNFDSYLSEQQNEYFSILNKYQKDNPKVAKYFATDEFRSDYHQPSQDFAQDCSSRSRWNGDQKEPANTNIDASDIAKLDKEVSEDLADDLKELAELFPTEDKDTDDMEDDLNDILKYRPYLAGQALKNNRIYPGLQDMQAQFLCRQMRDIYSTDEYWRGAEMAVAGAGLAMAGVFAMTGVGTPIAGALASVSAGAFITAEGAIAAQKINDGFSLEDAADMEHSLGFSSSADHAVAVENAESVQIEGAIDAGFALTGGVIATGGAVVKGSNKIGSFRAGTKTGSRASQTTDVTTTGREVAKATPRNEVAEVATQTTESVRRAPKALPVKSPVAKLEAPKGPTFYQDEVIPQVKDFVGQLDHLEDANVIYKLRNGTGETIQLNNIQKGGKLLDDGSGVLIYKDSPKYTEYLNSGYGIPSEQGVILRFGDDISNARVIYEKSDDAGIAFKTERNFSFVDGETPQLNGQVRTLDGVQTSLTRSTGLSYDDKMKFYNNLEQKIATNQRLSDEEIIAVAQRSGALRGAGQSRAEAILEVVTNRNPNDLEKLFPGSGASTAKYRNLLKEALESGAPPKQATLGIADKSRNGLPRPDASEITPAPKKPTMATSSVDEAVDVISNDNKLSLTLKDSPRKARVNPQTTGTALASAGMLREQFGAIASQVRDLFTIGDNDDNSNDGGDEMIEDDSTDELIDPPITNPVPETEPDEVEADIKITDKDNKITVTFKDVVKGCQLRKKIPKLEMSDGTVEEADDFVANANIESGKEYTMEKELFNYTVHVECKTEDEFKLAVNSSFPELSIVGNAKISILKCRDDECKKEDEDDSNPFRRGITPAPLKQFNAPQMNVPGTPVLNTL